MKNTVYQYILSIHGQHCMTPLGNILKRRRRMLGLSQEVVSKLSGITQPSLSRLELASSDANLSMEKYNKVSFILGILTFHGKKIMEDPKFFVELGTMGKVENEIRKIGGEAYEVWSHDLKVRFSIHEYIRALDEAVVLKEIENAAFLKARQPTFASFWPDVLDALDLRLQAKEGK